ncbi:MAG TPA: 1,4-dihydroxy-2-naphthoate polyprenyltransferase [Gemmatimonadales bacterium]
MRSWVLAARPHTLPAAVAPVLVGTAVGVHEGGAFRALPFAGALLGALLIQVATNFANDYSDFHRGADTAERMGPTRVTQSGLLEAAQVRRAIVVTFGLAVLVGLYLAWVGGWPIVAIGVASIVCGLAYTGGPWPYGYHGLGDLFVFVFFGLVAVCGSAYLQSGGVGALAVAAAIPVGFLATNILVVNNLRDLPTDELAGKRTLAVLLGARAVRWEYVALAALAYLAPVLLVARGLAGRWALLPWLTLPLALPLVRRVLTGVAGRALNEVLARTGRLQLAYSVLLAVGVVV